ncbi:MAG: nuclear transport factor 2 family protein [Anaerolineae bacterium]|nr:nuclear transport factor 2 family protein [Gemmatimonadaceae bacterium]
MSKWAYAVASVVAVNSLACTVAVNPRVAERGEAVIEAYVRAWNAHDSAAIESLLAPDAIHEDIAQNFRHEGKANVIAFMRRTMATQPGFKLRVATSIEDGRYFALEWMWTATYTGPDLTGKQVTDRPISARGATFGEVENGKIKRISDYWDLASAFR